MTGNVVTGQFPIRCREVADRKASSPAGCPDFKEEAGVQARERRGPWAASKKGAAQKEKLASANGEALGHVILESVVSGVRFLTGVGGLVAKLTLG